MKIKYKLQILIFFIIGVFVLSSGVTHAKLIFVGDIETGDWSQWCKEWGKIITSPVRNGNFAIKFTVDNDNRQETNLGCKTLFPDESERWVGISIFVPTDWRGDATGYMTLTQWHFDGKSPTGSQPLSLQLMKDIWTLRARDNNANMLPGIKSLPVKKGVWTDFVYHMKLSNNGFLRVWKDDSTNKDNPEILIDYQGPFGFRNDNPYFKMGIYTNQNDKLLIAYHDEVRFGDETSSYAEVAPSGKSTLPPPPPTGGFSGDLNSDNRVDVTDLGILLSNWGASGSADINNDGAVDVVDLGILLSNWS